MLRPFLPHHSNSIVQGLVSQLPRRQPSGPVLTALDLTFHHRHATITDIVLQSEPDWAGYSASCHVAAAAGAEELLDQTSRVWLNAHRGTSVT